MKIDDATISVIPQDEVWIYNIECEFDDGGLVSIRISRPDLEDLICLMDRIDDIVGYVDMEVEGGNIVVFQYPNGTYELYLLQNNGYWASITFDYDEWDELIKEFRRSL